jgi:hypothetical protein
VKLDRTFRKMRQLHDRVQHEREWRGGGLSSAARFSFDWGFDANSLVYSAARKVAAKSLVDALSHFV